MNTLATITFHGFIQFFSFLQCEIFVWTSVTELCAPQKGKLALTMSFFFISKAFQSL